MATVRLEAADRTEDLVGFITGELSDEMLDQVKVDREFKPVSGLASEPTTVAVTLTLGTAAIIAVARIIERWQENERQATAMRLVAGGFAKSGKAGKALAALAAKHTQVSISFGSPGKPRRP